MVFNTGAALLDAIVLAVVSKEEEGTYGYKITQDVRKAIDVSESTLYPVLRRLQKDGCLEVYDRECGGRNRRYYKITEPGQDKLVEYRREWEDYSMKISALFQERSFRGYEKRRIFKTVRTASGWNIRRRKSGCACVLPQLF